MDLNLYRDLQELKVRVRLSSKHQAISSNLLIEDTMKPLRDPLFEELNCKVKLFISRLEARERELIGKLDVDAAKLCQLSRRSFVLFVEMFFGESIGRSKDREAVLISEINASRDANGKISSAIGSG